MSDIQGVGPAAPIHLPEPVKSTQDRGPVQPVPSPGASVSVELESVVAKVQEKLNTVQPGLQIHIDQELKRPVVKIVDATTGEVVKQIPTEELLDASKRIDQMIGGLIHRIG